MTERPTFSPPRAGRGQEALTILIVDAHPLMRDGLANVLAGLGRRVEVLQADSLQAALVKLATRPDTTLVLLDLILPDAQGTRVLEQIRDAHPGIPIVVVSGATAHATVTAALRAGAMGFISKRSAPPVLLSALRLVLAGEVYAPPEVLRSQLLEPSRAAFSRAPATAAQRLRDGKELDLTRRQLDVLGLLVQGKSNKVICRELGLAEGTVKAHTAAIFRALRVSNRTEAGFAVNCLGLRIPTTAPAPSAEPRLAASRRLLAAA